MFLKKDKHSPSIDHIRMEQMFPTFNKKQKKNFINSSNTFLGNCKRNTKGTSIKNDSSFLKGVIEYIRGIDIEDINLLGMSSDVAEEYYLYKKRRKENRLRKERANTTFYGIDGTLNYLKVLKGMFSDNVYFRREAKRLFKLNIGKFLRSDEFMDYVTLILSCGVLAFLFFSLFFNIGLF